MDAEISPGETIHLNLCDAAGTREHSDMHSNDCGGQPTGPDMLVRVNVAVGGRYRLLTSSDADPLIYLRRVCDDQDSQITCRDDNASNFNARITRDFSAGDHFLVVDQYLEGDGTGCGELNLSFQPM
ncbi:MAG TPA: hypothetical protein ENK57_03685 [Polyangiaceae bacterium]|nr:hypothetical protein [Polyangiaceae bacterium]